MGVDARRPAVAGAPPEQPAPAKVPLQAPDQALQHLAHFAGPKMAEPFPGELTVLLAPGAIQGDDVEVGIESQVGRCPLHHVDRTGLRAELTLLRRAIGVERVHRLHEDAREVAEECAVLCEPTPPREFFW